MGICVNLAPVQISVSWTSKKLYMRTKTTTKPLQIYLRTFNCFSYVQADDVKLNSDPLLLEVTIQDLPQGKVSVTNLIVGSPANLTVPMVVYPPPQNEDYTWVIQDNSTNTKIEVNPGINTYQI